MIPCHDQGIFRALPHTHPVTCGSIVEYPDLDGGSENQGRQTTGRVVRPGTLSRLPIPLCYPRECGGSSRDLNARVPLDGMVVFPHVSPDLSEATLQVAACCRGGRRFPALWNCNCGLPNRDNGAERHTFTSFRAWPPCERSPRGFDPPVCPLVSSPRSEREKRTARRPTAELEGIGRLSSPG
ncbi:hypothetical protein GQ53DRAFT_57366 [Thozetella sp. PMI_491]|nr:hypothetical protein GQ53DRAFT_57366 [Thozetella sp. PMI_491]